MTVDRGAPEPGRSVPEPTGLLVIDKEAGWTSHDVVARVRRLLGQRRAGHAGTLDPDATGVLLVGLGRATRLLRFLTVLDKEYTAEIVLGVATSTLDASGQVVGEWDMSGVGIDRVRQAAAALTGPIEQVPPMVSAVKVGGRRLHALARQGVEVERQPRPVTVHRFAVEATGDPAVLRATVRCSSGTYVRALAADLGTALGGGAHLRALRRTRIGSFGLAAARPVAAVGPEHVLPPAEALAHLDRVVVDAEAARLVAGGRPLERAAVGAAGDGPWTLVDGTGRLLAVYQPAGAGQLRPAVVVASS
ncbi:MAG: tRNA pseudouridine(55) synthase TruB [Acidimicrobiales bacterium]